MNDNLALLLAPMGCYTKSHGSQSFQRESQSYVRDPRFAAEGVERRRLIRAVLSVRRFTPEVEMTICAHLRRFDLKDVWSTLTSDRRVAASREIFDRVHAAACGRANGTAVFAPLVSNMAVREGALRPNMASGVSVACPITSRVVKSQR